MPTITRNVPIVAPKFVLDERILVKAQRFAFFLRQKVRFGAPAWPHNNIVRKEKARAKAGLNPCKENMEETK